MRSPPSRRWPSLLDLMILSAATGAALALLRPYLASLPPRNLGPSGDSLRIQEGIYGCWSLLAAWWMLGLLLIQRRPPRAARSRLVRRPGQVACVALLASLLVGGLRLAVVTATGEEPLVRPGTMPYQIWIQLSTQAAPMILGAWSILVLGGRWRADPGWVDRLGRGLGCCWVAWSVLFFVPFHVRTRWFAIFGWFQR